MSSVFRIHEFSNLSIIIITSLILQNERCVAILGGSDACIWTQGPGLLCLIWPGMGRPDFPPPPSPPLVQVSPVHAARAAPLPVHDVTLGDEIEWRGVACVGKKNVHVHVHVHACMCMHVHA